MSKIDLPHDLANGQPVDAAPVQANFALIQLHINQELIERDGSVSMTGQLGLVGNPTEPLHAAPKQYVDNIVPIGGVIMWTGTTAPTGGRWVLCQNQLLATADYPDCFAVTGYKYGGSGGSFATPNLMDSAVNGRMPRGVAGTTAHGTAGGSQDAVVVSHQHDMSHTHPASVTGAESAHVHAGVDHLHAAGGLGMTTVGVHSHVPSNGGKFIVGGTGADADTDLTTGGGNYGSVQTTNPTGDHAHTVTGFTGGADRALTTGPGTGHQHTTPAHAHSGNTTLVGSTGSGANLPPYVGIAFILRVL